MCVYSPLPDINSLGFPDPNCGCNQAIMFNHHRCFYPLVIHLTLFLTYLQFCKKIPVIMNFATEYIQKVHPFIYLNLLPNSLRKFYFSVMENSKCLWSACHLRIMLCINSHISPQTSPFVDWRILVQFVSSYWQAFQSFWPSMLHFSMYFQSWVYHHWEGRATSTHSRWERMV